MPTQSHVASLVRQQLSSVACAAMREAITSLSRTGLLETHPTQLGRGSAHDQGANRKLLRVIRLSRFPWLAVMVRSAAAWHHLKSGPLNSDSSDLSG